jgi:hypothetical protein
MMSCHPDLAGSTRTERIRAAGASPMVPNGFCWLGPLPATAEAITVLSYRAARR